MKKTKTSGTSGGDRKFLVGFICNCATELRLVLTALLLLCSLATLLQFFPARFFLPFYSNSLPACASSPSVVLPDNISPSPPPPSPRPLLEEVVENGVVRRVFNPVGTAAYNFVLMSAYRGGPNTFAVMGLSSKSLHVFGHPIYTCEYQSNNNNNNETVTISVRGRKILPDWGYGRVYTTVVINCTFPENDVAVMDSASGGRLLLHASPNGSYDTRIKTVSDTILALDEPPASWNLSRFVDASPQYDYLYCGSPIYGSLSPQRVREWIAYHVRLFGGRSHFVIHDAGGVHAEVLEVLKPWMDLGYVTLQDIREQERFDSYYHNQFLVVNDCLHRYRFDAKWMFFFDIDEFIYLSSWVDSFETVMDSLTEYTMFSIEQVPMSNQLCLIDDSSEINKKWGFEKLVYKNMKRVTRKDRKYAVQPRNVFATGVHVSQNYQGSYKYITSDLMRYFHYHGTIAQRREPCRNFINDSSIVVEDIPYERDNKMKSVASLVKGFELDTIGSRLHFTKQ